MRSPLDRFVPCLPQQPTFVLGLCLVIAGCGTPPREINVSGELIRGLESDNPDERLDAAVAVGAMSSVPQDVADALLEALNDDDVEVRVAAAEALAALGDDGHFYTDTMQRAYEAENDPDVRKAYEESFAAIAAGSTSHEDEP